MTAPRLRTLCAGFVLSVSLLGAASPLAAQSSTQDLLDRAAEDAGRINDVLRALQTSDPNTQYALVKLLLAEKDPAMVRIGREFALFSTNPVLQNMAIQSVFNTNPQVRLDVSGGGGLETYGWVEHVNGVATENGASVMLETGTYNDTCWATKRGYCIFTIRGVNVQYNYAFNHNKAQANLTLGPDGVLRGPIVMNTGRAQAAIDLKE